MFQNMMCNSRKRIFKNINIHSRSNSLQSSPLTTPNNNSTIANAVAFSLGSRSSFNNDTPKSMSGTNNNPNSFTTNSAIFNTHPTQSSNSPQLKSLKGVNINDQ